ncbi:MAG: FumA C-terminus/TtdB family hydratase beta subunit [Candidatus Micrarchaeota archaeon]|mgnify:CR=1 FL=1
MKYELKTPLSNEQVIKLRLNDIIYLSGKLFSIRDQAMRRILEEKHPHPELKNAAIYNCGPLVRKKAQAKEGGKKSSSSKSKGSEWELISAGPTTSSRMNDLAVEFIERFGVSAIIGKGGMNEKVLEAMKGKCVYLSAVGGSGAISAQQLKVTDVEWEDLGMPEAFWKLDAKGFGPLIVSMDANGNSLYQENIREVEANLKKLI